MSSTYKHGKVFRNGREQINNTVKAKDIFLWLFNGYYSKNIFNSKKNRNYPFSDIKKIMISRIQFLHALQHHKNDTKYDRNN